MIILSKRKGKYNEDCSSCCKSIEDVKGVYCLEFGEDNNVTEVVLDKECFESLCKEIDIMKYREKVYNTGLY